MPRKVHRTSDRKWAKIKQVEQYRALRTLRHELHESWKETRSDRPHGK